MLVRQVGEAFRHVSTASAKPAIDFFSDQFSLKPSFRMDAAFGTKRREVTRDGDIIIRQASSEHFSEESFEQRFKRILNRHKFETLKNIFGAFDCTTVDLLKALLSAGSFVDFLQIVGGELETLPGDLLDNAAVKQAFADGFSVGCGVQEGLFCSVGYAFASRRAKVRRTEAAIAVLDRLLTALKRELLHD